MNADTFKLIVETTGTPNTIAVDRADQEKEASARCFPRTVTPDALVAAGSNTTRKAHAEADVNGNAFCLVVNVHRLPDVDARLHSLAKRAKRLGLVAPTARISRRFGAFVRYNDCLRFQAFALVIVDGPEIRLPGGWKLAAVIDHDSSTHGNLIRSVPGIGIQIPTEFRTARPTCDHCGTARLRKETFVVVSEAGEFRRVGRSCLADFLGHGTTGDVAARAAFVCELGGLRDEDYEGFGGCRLPAACGIVDFLLAVAVLIKLDGWISRTNSQGYGDATADRAFNALRGIGPIGAADEKRIKNALDSDRNAFEPLATGALAWARTQAGESDYCHNLRVACAEDEVTARTAGIVASAISAYNRELDRATERKQGPSIKGDAWIGKAGDKFGRKPSAKDKRAGVVAHPAITGTVLRYSFTENEWGETTIVTVVTDDGQIVKWFASNYDPEGDGIERGSKVSVVGTVKKQSEWKGQKETILTRCVVTLRD